jgi:hypothetical protein
MSVDMYVYTYKYVDACRYLKISVEVCRCHFLSADFWRCLKMFVDTCMSISVDFQRMLLTTV